MAVSGIIVAHESPVVAWRAVSNVWVAVRVAVTAASTNCGRGEAWNWRQGMGRRRWRWRRRRRGFSGGIVIRRPAVVMAVWGIVVAMPKGRTPNKICVTCRVRVILGESTILIFLTNRYQEAASARNNRYSRVKSREAEVKFTNLQLRSYLQHETGTRQEIKYTQSIKNLLLPGRRSNPQMTICHWKPIIPPFHLLGASLIKLQVEFREQSC